MLVIVLVVAVGIGFGIYGVCESSVASSACEKLEVELIDDVRQSRFEAAYAKMSKGYREGHSNADFVRAASAFPQFGGEVSLSNGSVEGQGNTVTTHGVLTGSSRIAPIEAHFVEESGGYAVVGLTIDGAPLFPLGVSTAVGPERKNVAGLDRVIEATWPAVVAKAEGYALAAERQASLQVDTLQGGQTAVLELGGARPFHIALTVQPRSAVRAGPPLFQGNAPVSAGFAEMRLPGHIAQATGIGLTVGSPCEVRVLPRWTAAQNCSVLVRCGDVVLYGGIDRGINHCEVEGGAATRAVDPRGTAEDADPKLDFDLDARRVVVGDDTYRIEAVLGGARMSSVSPTPSGKIRPKP